MVIPPTITMRMEITIATIGRLMKNFDMELFPLRPGYKGLGVHSHPRTHLLDSLSDHTVTWFQAFRNHPLAAYGVADFDWPNAHFVLAIHNRSLITSLQFGAGALWDNQCILLRADDGADSAISSGPQNGIRIGKQRGHPERTGALVDLAVSEGEGTFVCIG